MKYSYLLLNLFLGISIIRAQELPVDLGYIPPLDDEQYMASLDITSLYASFNAEQDTMIVSDQDVDSSSRYTDPQIKKQAVDVSLILRIPRNIIKQIAEQLRKNNPTIITHNNKKFYYCQACDHLSLRVNHFSNHTKTKNHIRNINNGNNIPLDKYEYTCEACNIGTNFEHILISHKQSSSHLKNIAMAQETLSEDHTSYPCHTCKLGFMKKCYLIKHRNTREHKRKAYENRMRSIQKQ